MNAVRLMIAGLSAAISLCSPAQADSGAHYAEVGDTEIRKFATQCSGAISVLDKQEKASREIVFQQKPSSDLPFRIIFDSTGSFGITATGRALGGFELLLAIDDGEKKLINYTPPFGLAPAGTRYKFAGFLPPSFGAQLARSSALSVGHTDTPDTGSGEQGTVMLLVDLPDYIGEFVEKLDECAAEL